MALKSAPSLKRCPKEKTEFQGIQIISRDTLVTNSVLISLGAHQGIVTNCLGRHSMKMTAVILIVCRCSMILYTRTLYFTEKKQKNRSKCKITIFLISKHSELKKPSE